MITTKTISLNHITEDKFIQDLAQKVAAAREESIMAQLSDLVAKGILVVKVQGNAFYKEADSSNLVYRESLTLELNVQDYVSRLEKENAELKEQIEGMRKLLGIR